MTGIATIAKGLSEALAKHDKTCAGCPVDMPGFDPSKRCPVCRATSAQSCVMKDHAAYEFVASVRAYLENSHEAK